MKRRFLIPGSLVVGLALAGFGLRLVQAMPTGSGTAFTDGPQQQATPHPTPTAQSAEGTPPATGDLSGAVLTLEDLPPGFEPIPESELAGLSTQAGDLTRSFGAISQARLQNLAIFRNPDPQQLEVVFCFLLTPLSRVEQASFDRELSNPDAILEGVAAGLSGSDIGQPQLLPGMDDVGEGSIGFGMVATVQFTSLQMDVVIARRGEVVESVWIMYREGQQPLIGVLELARILDSRVAAAIPATGVSISGFRPTGPLVPELTTHIPTPLDISTEPAVIGTNLLLAALVMIPFAVASEVLNKTLEENEPLLQQMLRPVRFIGRLQQRMEAALRTRLARLALLDAAKVVGVVLFYGLVFSFLERGWNPLSLTGFYLFVSMTIAFGVVGIADDIVQWLAARRWGLQAELTLRPANLLLAVASTAVSRLLGLMPGIMFGTPEAFEVDEASLEKQRKARLLKIGASTTLMIGIGVWLLTALTTLLQRVALPGLVAVLIGGVESLLLLVFAVTVENMFVQLLAAPDSYGRALRRWNRLLWAASLLGITFLFYHTLINPRGEVAEALRSTSVLLFLITVGAFVAFTVVVRLALKWLSRREARRMARLPTAPAPRPVPATAEELAVPERAEAHRPPVELPQCARCGESFAWEDAYRHTNTPGSDPHNPPGHASFRPRVFCPRCGDLVVEWHVTRERDFNEWAWFGDNAEVNAGCALPPDPNRLWGKNIPTQFVPLYEEHQLDIGEVQQFEREQEGRVEEESTEAALALSEEGYRLARAGDLQGALRVFEQAASAGLSRPHQACALGSIGFLYLHEKEDVDAAFDYSRRSVELDPAAYWQAHSILELVYNRMGDHEKAQERHDDALRFAGTRWWEPDVEQRLRDIVRGWTPPAAAPPAPAPPEPRAVELGHIERVTATKNCPRCGKEIKAEARVCRHCRTRFEVTVKGYCLNCHAVVEVDPHDRCQRCGSDVEDRHVESKWLGEPEVRLVEPVPVQAAAAVFPTARKGRAWLWALIGVLSAACIAGAVGLWVGRERISQLAELFATAVPGIAPADQARPFTEPILAAIGDRLPDYSDDFGDPSSGWPVQSNARLETSYEEGVYSVLIKTADTGSGLVMDGLGDFDDFVAQVDVQWVCGEQGNVGFLWRFDEGGDPCYGGWIGPPHKRWGMWNRAGTMELGGRSNQINQEQEWNRLTLVVKGEEIALYANDEPLALASDDVCRTGGVQLNVHAGEPGVHVLLDNFRVWDISDLMAAGETPAPTRPLSPDDQARAFAEPILAAITGQEPDYSDDFANPGSGWPTGSTAVGDEWGYEDRAYRISATYRPQGGCCVGAGPDPEMWFSDFVLEVDAQFVAGERGSWFVTFRDSPEGDEQPSGAHYGVRFYPDGTFGIWKNVGGAHIELLEDRGQALTFERGFEANHLAIVARGPQFAVYINGQPLWLIHDESSRGGTIHLGVENETDNTKLGVRFDNVKVWDITGLVVPGEMVAPTGRLVYFDDKTGNSEIYVANTDGSGERRLTHHPAQDREPTWSPDGTRIVFTSDRDAAREDNWQLYVLDADGSNLSRLSYTDRNDLAPCWSPDGSRIAFHSSCDLAVINADGSNWTILVQGHEDLCAGTPAWSPDSHRIAFRSVTPPDGPPRQHDIYVVNDDGSGLLRLASFASEAWGGPVAWSPDRDRVAFDMWLDGQRKTYTVNSDGSSEPQEITHIPESWYPNFWPQWSQP